MLLKDSCLKDTLLAMLLRDTYMAGRTEKLEPEQYRPNSQIKKLIQEINFTNFSLKDVRAVSFLSLNSFCSRQASNGSTVFTACLNCKNSHIILMKIQDLRRGISLSIKGLQLQKGWLHLSYLIV